MIEREVQDDTGSQYSYIVDNETFLNIGRLLGSGIIITLGMLSSQKIGLFYGPICIAALYVAVLFIFRRVKDRKANNP